MKNSCKILLPVLFYLVTFPVTAQHSSDLEEWNLKGKVKSITAHEWTVRDSLGQTIKRKKIMGFGLMNHFTLFNTSGFIVESTELDSTRGKKAMYYAYDAQQQKISSTRLNRDKTKITYTYEYKTKGNQRTTYTIDEKGERWKSEEATLDDKGRTVESLTYEKGDTLSATNSYAYDDGGHLVTMNNSYSRGSKYTWSWKWKDGVKQQGIKIMYQDEKKISGTTYFYDQANHVTRELEATYSTLTNRATRYEYTFDEKGNWLTRKMYMTGEDGKKTNLYFYAERQITYYE